MENDNEIKKLAVDVLNGFCAEITDMLFLRIQNNKDLKAKYDHLVAGGNNEVVNQNLGYLFKKILNLENEGECKEPKSKLIKSYTRHCLPRNNKDMNEL